MKSFALKFCIFTLLLACPLLGCRSSQPKSDFVDFAKHACWDPAKEQRWQEFRLTFETEYSRIQPAVDDGSSPDTPSPDTVHPNQLDLDRIEKRRTGNPHATSCRRAVIPGRVYDYSNCSPWQLAAELFQEDEENDGHK